MTSRCAITAWPSRLKASSDRSASRASAPSTTLTAATAPGSQQPGSTLAKARSQAIPGVGAILLPCCNDCEVHTSPGGVLLSYAPTSA